MFHFYYKAYNIPVFSTLSLSSLYAIEKTEAGNIKPITIDIGVVPDTLKSPAHGESQSSIFNESEYLLKIPNVASYYVADGKTITVEPFCANSNEISNQIYTSCLAAALLQRNILTFHVSGVRIEDKVLLLAAPSGVGKSTTALKLHEYGYPLFTDDTAVLNVENGICYATASYPLSRIFQTTIDSQSVYKDAQKEKIWGVPDKYAFGFHDRFNPERKEVAGIVFLEIHDQEIAIEPISPSQCLEKLIINTYVMGYINGMKKQVLQFENVAAIANSLPAFKAIRPSQKLSIDSFSEKIATQILENI